MAVQKSNTKPIIESKMLHFYSFTSHYAFLNINVFFSKTPRWNMKAVQSYYLAPYFNLRSVVTNHFSDLLCIL
jgi:hypothetical protein